MNKKFLLLALVAAVVLAGITKNGKLAWAQAHLQSWCCL